MLRTEAIKDFLTKHGRSPYAARYSSDMEAQVNVARDNGVRIRGEYMGKSWVGWTDEKTTWKSFRIPWNAKTDPSYEDSDLRFSLEEHAEGIGMTGWSWVSKTSLWFGYDFDSITNHKAGLSDDELTSILEALSAVPWVTITSSTSGRGYHVYVDLAEPIETATHTEHAAVARAVLSLLSLQTGINLENSVDTCGMVLWVWHRKQEGTKGLSILKHGEPLSPDKLPKNWKDHIEVIARKRAKVKGNCTDEKEFQALFSSTRVEKLDEDHKQLLKWFDTNAKQDFWWDNDHNMLVCHTFDLKTAHTDLKLKGIFETLSSGSSTQNAYAFPIEGGSWTVRRHSLNVREHPSWVVDPSGWTRCLYNELPDFLASARTETGIENSKGEYVFSLAEAGLRALSNIGLSVKLPEMFLRREMIITEKPDKFIIRVTRNAADPQPEGFLCTKKGESWEAVVHYRKKKKEVFSLDHIIRHTVASGEEVGWWINVKETWIQESRQNVASVVNSQEGISRSDLDSVLSKAILSPWELVNLPFQEEYPGDRQWNNKAARLSCQPVSGDHKTWTDLLEHVGEGLNQAVLESDWCAQNAIKTGAEYLLVWVASMLQQPLVPLPYLFFIGPQNSGKSSLHEALHLLMSRGYARADHALLNRSGFNDEIENAVLCVVEETDLKTNKEAANRIKDWVTGKTISINTKFQSVHDVRNTTHWIQCANDASYCMIFPGDTRIVVNYVDLPKYPLPKHILFGRLEKEKAAFLDLVLSIELPEPEGRLGIPVVTSAEKATIETSNMSDLEQFIVEEAKVAHGQKMHFEYFYAQFLLYIKPERKSYWTRMRVSKEFPRKPPFVKGRLTTNEVAIGNMAFEEMKDNGTTIVLNSKGKLEERIRNG